MQGIASAFFLKNLPFLDIKGIFQRNLAEIIRSQISRKIVTFMINGESKGNKVLILKRNKYGQNRS